MGRPPKSQKQIELDKKIGQRIKLIRKNMKNVRGIKITQSDFAEHYGVSDQAVRDWESGRSRVPDEVLENLSESFGIDVDFIKCKYDTPNLNKLLENWNEEFDSGQISKELILFERVKSLGFIKIDSDDPEKEYSDFINYIKQFNEREVRKMTRNDVKVIKSTTTNEIRENFETGEFTLYAVTEEDIEKGFQQLIRRGIIEE